MSDIKTISHAGPEVERPDQDYPVIVCPHCGIIEPCNCYPPQPEADDSDLMF